MTLLGSLSKCLRTAKNEVSQSCTEGDGSTLHTQKSKTTKKMLKGKKVNNKDSSPHQEGQLEDTRGYINL